MSKPDRRSEGEASGPPPHRLRATLALAGLLLATALAYAPGLRGPFIFDDLPAITEADMIAAKRLDLASLRNAAFTAGRSYPDRGLARVSFAINYYLAGQRFDPLAFKATNLAIHLANGVLVALLVAALCTRHLRRRGERGARRGAWAVALAVTGVWLLHPIQLTSVLYVVQRMTSLASLFVLLGLLAYLGGRARLERGARGGWTLLLGGGTLAMALGFLSKQNALLLPLFAFAVELFFLERAGLGRVDRRRLYALGLLTVALPLAAGVVLVALPWEPLFASYVIRPFTMVERVLTEGRVLFYYLSLLVYPVTGRFGPYHDDFEISRGLLEPLSTAPALAAWMVLLVLALTVGRRRRAPWAFAVVWYLAGHSMESTVLPLELVFEHRNYLPILGPLVAAGLYGRALLARAVGRPGLRLAICLLPIVAVGMSTAVLASLWADERALTAFLVRHHPGSPRSQATYASIDLQAGRDLQEVYRLQLAAARAQRRPLLPLIEMVRLAAGARRMVALRQAPAAPGGTVPPLAEDLLDNELVYDVDYLDRLIERLDRQIRLRLASDPIVPATIATLGKLRECTIAAIDICLPIADRIIAWHRIALANPRRERGTTARLADSLGRLYAFTGDLGRARRYARLAVASAGPREEFYYRASEAAFYIRFRRWAEAEEAIRALEHDTPWSPYLADTLAFVRNLYREGRAAEEAERKPPLRAEGPEQAGEPAASPPAAEARSSPPATR